LGLLAFLLLAPVGAQAQALMLRSSGERIAPLGLVPVAQRDAVRRLTSVGAVQVGFVYEFSAVNGVTVWTANGRYCLYMDDTYWVISKADAARLLGSAKVSPPFTYTLPISWMVAIVLAVLAALWRWRGKRFLAAVERRAAASEQRVAGPPDP